MAYEIVEGSRSRNLNGSGSMDGFNPNFKYEGDNSNQKGSDVQDEEIKVELKESIKLTQNSKGWNFEIKIIDKEDIEKQMDRLDRITQRMLSKYPKTPKT